MGSLKSQGYLYSARDVLEPLVRDLQKRKGQGVCWVGRWWEAVMGMWVDGGMKSWALSEEEDRVPHLFEKCKGLCQPSVTSSQDTTI